MIVTHELRVQLEMLMRETRSGSKPVYLITEEGDVYEINKVEYDPENDAVYMHGALYDE